MRKKKKTEEANQPVGRITNETVAEHREQILAGGRRYKYPMQYAKHTLVRNTLIISGVAIILLIALCWWQLYSVQNTSKFFYRLTQLVPAPVAKVDGGFVRYSSYLMELRSALYYLEREDAVNFNAGNGQAQRNYQKRVALDKVVNSVYTAKLAKENKIKVTDKELDEFIDGQLKTRKPPITEQAFEQVINDFYDWSIGEYKESLKAQLLTRKVAFKIDKDARKKADQLAHQARNGDFAALAREHSDDETTKVSGGDVGFVSKDTEDPDGLVKAAAGLKLNEVSQPIEGRNGYYVIKLLEINDTQVHYARAMVGLKELDRRLIQIRKDNKVQEFITIPKTTAANGQ